MWTLRCLISFVLSLNLLPQNAHSIAFSPVCPRTWSTNFDCSQNFLLQMLHSSGFFLVWARICLSSFFWLLNLLLQKVHSNGVILRSVQMMHSSGFSPVWARVWLSSFFLTQNLCLQIVHSSLFNLLCLPSFFLVQNLFLQIEHSNGLSLIEFTFLRPLNTQLLILTRGFSATKPGRSTDGFLEINSTDDCAWFVCSSASCFIISSTFSSSYCFLFKKFLLCILSWLLDCFMLNDCCLSILVYKGPQCP